MTKSKEARSELFSLMLDTLMYSGALYEVSLKDFSVSVGNAIHFYMHEEQHESLKGGVFDKIYIYGLTKEQDFARYMINSVLKPAILSRNGEIINIDT